MADNNGNVQLQLRGGKNYPALSAIVKSMSRDSLVLKNTELVVLEGTDDLDVVETIGGLLYVIPFLPDEFVSVHNRTGGDLQVALCLEDKYGSSIELDSEIIPDDDYGYFETGTLFCLSKGDRLVLRVLSGNIAAGDGVAVNREMCRIVPGLLTRLTLSEKITQSTFKYGGTPGVSNVYAIYNIFNMSSTPVDITQTIYLEGNPYEVNSDTLDPWDYAELYLIAHEGIETELQFSPLPGDGYLYGAIVGIGVVNAFNAQPLLVG